MITIVTIAILILFLVLLYYAVKGICYVVAKICIPLHLGYILAAAFALLEMKMLDGTVRILFLIFTAILFLRIGFRHLSELSSHSKDDYEYSKARFQSTLVGVFAFFFSVFAFLYLGMSLIPSLLTSSEKTSGFLSIVQIYHETNADIYLLVILAAIAYIKAWKRGAELEICEKPSVAPPRRNEIALYFDAVLPDLKLPDTVTADHAKQMLKEYLAENITGISEEIATQITEELYFCSLAGKKESEQIWGELNELPSNITEQLQEKLCKP